MAAPITLDPQKPISDYTQDEMDELTAIMFAQVLRVERERVRPIHDLNGNLKAIMLDDRLLTDEEYNVAEEAFTRAKGFLDLLTSRLHGIA